MTKYIAHITPLNADKIGTKAHGTATFEENGDNLHIHVEMFDTPANIEHWEHFHGFADGKKAHVPTSAQDVNHDGFIDLPETEPVSGTTMVPLDDAPQDMNIPHDGYPVADANGHYEYDIDVPLDKLQTKFADAFGSRDLQLGKRVVYVHGVPASLELPASVAGDVMSYDAHTTLPIAAGEIEKA
ncbi:MAG: hypothetical protein LKH59_07220 [Lactobacillus crispatus]|jgi:hypothetical protein|uniref:hypothetical protein n=1 Tax=Lactobacillus crispatus TaxID=47770 RepID=UPI0018AADC8B|nr:hypothetical protein [Lactobacillus crispatus]MCH4003565.1 hypothetical protein [Lactobacillus crispatus]MCI1336438.1 hypothetical protein [Lactobacillus crispatus]MCI1365935.1 hypothetical protein [Lactobacillus crispatus]MCI1494308.1 hypothetical protein [Lactobacillus crispatus]MCI1523952.1 hypothetical protein [Lactobacillus crispatus]